MEQHKKLIEAYLSHNNYELTYERKIMIGIIEKMETFVFKDFKAQAFQQNITTATVYNFKNLLIECEIILPEVRIASRFNDSPIEIEKILSKVPVKEIGNVAVRERILKSYK